jgi:hypothetical protein
VKLHLQHAANFAKIRTDLAMLDRSSTINDDERHAIKTDIWSDLAELFEGDLGPSNIIYPPPSLDRIGVTADMSYDQKKALFGLNDRCSKGTSAERRFQRYLQDNAAASLSQNWIWRLGEAAEELKEWYPFFVTLTVDPKRYDSEALWKDGTAWRNYVRQLAVVAMKASGLSRSEIKKTSNRDYLQYMATIEHGKSGHHNHCHAIVFLKNIPDTWKRDPNGHRQRAVNRRCPPLETYWPYCDPQQRPALYFWFLGCKWQKLGHKIPLLKNGEGLKLLPATCAGAYCAKYMAKEKKQWFHRVKATHKLGLSRITKHLSTMALEHLEMLARRPPTYELNLIRQKILTVPSGLLKSLTKIEIYKRTYRNMSLKELIEVRPSAYGAMLKSVNNGLKPWRMASKELYDWLLSVLPPEKTAFCEETFFDSICEMLLFQEANNETVSTIAGFK